MPAKKKKEKKEVVQKTILPVEPPLYLRGYFPVLIIALLAFLVYAPTLRYDFSPMDERWLIISQKELMSHLSNLPVLFRSSMMGMYYRPVCASSFMFDLILGNGSPFIFHFTNILLHVLCSVLLFRFFLQLTISRPLALISALIFAVHPISVHAVAWIPGRNDSLLCLFTVLSCSQLVLYFNTRKAIYLVIHLLAFCLALFSKENAVLLPLLYFLLWFLFQERKEFRKLVVPVLSWLVIGVSWFFIRKHVVDYFPPVTSATTGKSLLNFLKALTAYTGKFILPVDQSVMPVLRDMSLISYLIATLLLIAATLKFGLRDKKIALFGFIWFYIFLFLPAWVGATDSNGDQYEHRIYTSLIGAFLFLSQLKISIDPALARKLSVILLIVFSVKTIARCTVYTDEFSFLQAATAESPSVSLFHDMLGYKYVERKDYQNAIESFSEAIRLDPNRYEFYNHRGSAYFDTKNYKLAMDDFNKTISG
ncbi:MAG TPA: tetratricopeptide repeat protein, partial [Bacteroidia bacterium]|nr:tetratricopeptide repeat protein [Bacteroidia bacterium]